MNTGALGAFRNEARALARGIASVSAAECGRATRCTPWSVRELLGHVCVVLGWLPGMLDQPAPAHAAVSAAGYYRPDHRFDAATNADRIRRAQQRLAGLEPAELQVEFARVWQEVEARCRLEPAGRVVRTRHGDAMLLDDFLLTRLVELTLHGLDLADALGREPWLTSQAADLVVAVLLGDNACRAAETGWSRAQLLRRATGRAPLTPAESALLTQLGIHRLALG